MKFKLPGLNFKKPVKKVLNKAFGKKGKKVWNYLSNPLRAMQRSHRFGHTTAPSWSDSNQVTRLFNQAVSSLGRSGMRAAQRQAASMAGNSGSTASQAVVMPSVDQRLDYSYRRLRDLM